MTVVLQGLIHVYGPPSSGKTSLALTAGDPKKTVMLDGDTGKSRLLAEQLGLKGYHDLTAMSEGQTEVQHFRNFRKLVDELPDGLDVIVWDEPMGEYIGGHSYVKDNRKEFRKHWNAMGSIAGAQEWRILRSVLLPQLHNTLLKKASLVIICSHEKPDRDDDSHLTGFTVPDAEDSLRKMAGVVLRLARNTRDHTSPEPVGLVIKNTGTIKDGKPIRMFPERIAPCNWEKIKYYIDNPVGNRQLSEEETPDEFEHTLITGTLNPEQRKVVEMAKKWQALQAAEAEALDVVSAITEIKSENEDMPLPMLINKVLSDLDETYPDLTAKKIKEILESQGE